MVDKTSHMFITGPDVIKTVTGEDVEFEELGGAQTHNTKSGVAHYMGADEEDALDYVKSLLSFLPSNNAQMPPVDDVEVDLEPNGEDMALDTFIPDSMNQPYDMHTVIETVVDDGDFLECSRWGTKLADRIRSCRGTARRNRREPADAVRGHARHRCL